jgi:hypothetical protein
MGALEKKPAGSGEPPGHPLQIMPHDAPTAGVRLAVRKARWPSAAGLAYAIVMTLGWFVAGGFGFEWHVFLLMTIWFAWPIVITVGLAIALSWRELALLVFERPSACWCCSPKSYFLRRHRQTNAHELVLDQWTWDAFSACLSPPSNPGSGFIRLSVHDCGSGRPI